MKHCAEFRSPVQLFFIDFEKTFDSVRRECIWNAPRWTGILGKLATIIRATYNEKSRARVVSVTYVFLLRFYVNQNNIKIDSIGRVKLEPDEMKFK